MTGQSAAIGVAELIVVIYRFNSRRDIKDFLPNFSNRKINLVHGVMDMPEGLGVGPDDRATARTFDQIVFGSIDNHFFTAERCI